LDVKRLYTAIPQHMPSPNVLTVGTQNLRFSVLQVSLPDRSLWQNRAPKSCEHEMSAETYKTPREAAEYLRSSTSTLAKLRVYGGGPTFCRLGRSIRYRIADLDEFMARHSARSTSDRNGLTSARKCAE
jgi:excisionase family DNA binding protein